MIICNTSLTIEALDMMATLCNLDFNRVEFDAVRGCGGLINIVMILQKCEE